MKWYDPAGCRERLKRAACFLNITVLILSAALIFSEFRFDW